MDREQIRQGINALLDNAYIPDGVEVNEVTVSLQMRSTQATLRARREDNGVWTFINQSDDD